jgi:hypothetical protein
MTAVFDNNDPKLKGSRRLVLLSLADNANDQGYCWPSLETISRKSNLNRRYIIDILQWLEDNRYIQRERRYQTSTVYLVMPASLAGVFSGDARLTSLVMPASPEPSLNQSNSDKPKSGLSRTPDPPPNEPAQTKKPMKERDPLIDHPAVMAYRDVSHLSVPIAMRPEVATVTDCELWRQIVLAWIGYGWNPRNIAGMLEAYRSGGIQPRKNGSGKASSDEPASYPALRRAWEKENGVGTFPPDLKRLGNIDAIDVEVFEYAI